MEPKNDVVNNNSSLMHVAATLGIPQVAIYAPPTPIVRHP